MVIFSANLQAALQPISFLKNVHIHTKLFHAKTLIF